MDVLAVSEEFRLPDELWERMEGILPRRRKHKSGGRPPLPWRQVLDGIFYVLRTGCQWNAVPKAYGSSSSLHRYFQELVAQGVFARLWRMALYEYDDLKGIDWEFQSMDGAMTKSPLGGEKYRAKSNGSSQTRDQAKRAYRWRRNPSECIGRRCQHA